MSDAPLRVLFVEDHPGDARLVRELLAEAGGPGFDVHWGRSLGEAAEALAGGCPDAVLLDLGLPDSQGLATFARLRDLCPGVPVLVLSGLGDQRVALEAVAQGAQDYLVKGEVDGPRLARALRYAVERRRLEERLLDARKMEAVGLLAGGIAHEFNNLLTVILGSLELLEEDTGDLVLFRRRVADMQAAGQRAAHLTGQLLAFSRRQILRPAELDLNALVVGVAQTLRGRAPASIAVELDLAPGLPTVRADRSLVERSLVQLGVNACEAMPGGGTLTLGTRDAPAGALPGCTPAEPPLGPSVAVTVSDTGRGIPAGRLAHVFEPFYTTKEVGLGTGLGLAEVYGVAKQSRGHVCAHGVPGRGSTFHLYLPRAEPND
ncbi:MAG: sensor histidine kinase [Deferrisomatales bacterium]